MILGVLPTPSTLYTVMIAQALDGHSHQSGCPKTPVHPFGARVDWWGSTPEILRNSCIMFFNMHRSYSTPM